MRFRREIIAALVLGFAMAAYLQHDPIEIDMHELERPAVPPATVDTPVALLCVDLETIRSSATGTWEDFDASFAWWSDLREEFGRTSPVAPSEIAGILDHRVQVLVISRSARTLGETETMSILDWVDDGGVAVFELPARAAQKAMGLELSDPMSAGVVDSVAFTSSYWPTAEHPHLPAPPLRQVATREAPSWTPTLWIDGSAAAWFQERGEGRVLALGVDLSKWATTMRQGQPDANLGVHRTRGSNGREQFLQPNDFLAQPQRTTAWKPRADLLLRALLQPLRQDAPLLRFGALPPGARGVFLMTHDEEDFGDRSTFMTDESHRQGVGSTMFLVGERISAGATSRMLDSGADAQLHWNRGYWKRRLRRFGIGPFRPILREMSLIEQRDDLQARLPDTAPPVDLNRNHGLLWDESWTRTFRILEAAGFRFDSTYGVDEELFGWVFDTARPYHPLDDNGMPFELLELPFPYQDDENSSSDAQNRMLRESATVYNGVLAPIFHTTTMSSAPRADAMRMWLSVYEEAPRNQHPVWSVSEYMNFREHRLQSSITRLADRPTTFDIEIVSRPLVVEWPEGLVAFGAEGNVLPSSETVQGHVGVTFAPGRHRIRLEASR